jgi:hypothetical protein
VAIDKKISKQANVNSQLSNDAQIEFAACPMQ